MSLNSTDIDYCTLPYKGIVSYVSQLFLCPLLGLPGAVCGSSRPGREFRTAMGRKYQ